MPVIATTKFRQACPKPQVEMCVGEQVEALVRFSHVRNEEGFGSEVCLRARSVDGANVNCW